MQRGEHKGRAPFTSEEISGSGMAQKRFTLAQIHEESWAFPLGAKCTALVQAPGFPLQRVGRARHHDGQPELPKVGTLSVELPELALASTSVPDQAAPDGTSLCMGSTALKPSSEGRHWAREMEGDSGTL